MKRVITGFLSVALILLCASFVGAFQNEPEGFRGLKWGDPPTENMKYVTTIETAKVFTIPGDKMAIGSAKFYSIGYFFYKGQFMQVGLFFNGEKNYNLLKTICEGKFGKAAESGFYSSTWRGMTSNIILSYDMIKERGSLGISSFQIMVDRMNAQKEKEIEEAEGDW